MGLEQPIRLLLIGGAFMITQVHNRRTTKDVDVALLEQERWGQEYNLFRAVVGYVIDEMGGDSEWFSDDITEFLPLMGMPRFVTLWLTHGKIEAYVPEVEYILVLKLLSSRSKDRKDIRALLRGLGINNRHQIEALLQAYISADIQQEYAEKLAKVLKKLF